MIKSDPFISRLLKKNKNKKKNKTKTKTNCYSTRNTFVKSVPFHKPFIEKKKIKKNKLLLNEKYFSKIWSFPQAIYWKKQHQK